MAVSYGTEGGEREGGKGGGRGGRKKFYLKAELIKCIDPNEGEAGQRGRKGILPWGWN